MPAKVSKKIESKIIELYNTKDRDGAWIGSKIISQRLDISNQTVINVLVRNGVKIRNPRESHFQKRSKPIKNIPFGKSPFCACGCGKPTEWNRRKNKWNVYVVGHYRKNAPYKDKDWLKDAYRKKSVSDIASLFGVGKSTITKFMDKFKIKRRKQSESLKIGGKMKRENNPAWKGGVAKWDYASDWKSICREIRNRDKWTCQHCGEQRKHWGVSLHVHHIDKDKTNNNFSNLISLCAPCHRKIHSGQIKL